MTVSVTGHVMYLQLYHTFRRKSRKNFIIFKIPVVIPIITNTTRHINPTLRNKFDTIFIAG